MSTDDLNAPVCRHCGSDELNTLEEGTKEMHATWVRGDEGWAPEEYGDDAGDDLWETVGVICASCMAGAKFDGDDGVSAVITTRAAFFRTHPVRLWRAIDTTNRRRQFHARARTRQEAFALVAGRMNEYVYPARFDLYAVTDD